MGKEEKAEARIKPNIGKGISKEDGQGPGSSTAGAGKGREGKNGKSTPPKESSEGREKGGSSSGATGKGQEASEIRLTKVWEQANSLALDHKTSGKGRATRAMARIDFRSEFEDNGENPKCTRAMS